VFRAAEEKKKKRSHSDDASVALRALKLINGEIILSEIQAVR
jgi:hypothetical protein